MSVAERAVAVRAAARGGVARQPPPRAVRRVARLGPRGSAWELALVGMGPSVPLPLVRGEGRARLGRADGTEAGQRCTAHGVGSLSGNGLAVSPRAARGACDALEDEGCVMLLKSDACFFDVSINHAGAPGHRTLSSFRAFDVELELPPFLLPFLLPPSLSLSLEQFTGVLFFLDTIFPS